MCASNYRAAGAITTPCPDPQKVSQKTEKNLKTRKNYLYTKEGANIYIIYTYIKLDILY
jgi:hypothetical protein